MVHSEFWTLLTLTQVYAEATIAFPLIVAASFAKANSEAKDGLAAQADAQAA